MDYFSCRSTIAIILIHLHVADFMLLPSASSSLKYFGIVFILCYCVHIGFCNVGLIMSDFFIAQVSALFYFIWGMFFQKKYFSTDSKLLLLLCIWYSHDQNGTSSQSQWHILTITMVYPDNHNGTSSQKLLPIIHSSDDRSSFFSSKIFIVDLDMQLLLSTYRKLAALLIPRICEFVENINASYLLYINSF